MKSSKVLDDLGESMTISLRISIGLLVAAVAVVVLALLGAAHAAPMQQGGNCGSHQATTDQLREKYKETPVWYGITGNGAVMEMYASKDTWTLLLVFPNGNSCLVAAGGEHEYSPIPAPSKDI